MPQSTVSTRSTPSSASRASVSALQPVALLEPRRQVPRRLGAELAQQQDGERGGADAVGVVVAVDADARARRDRGADRLDRRAPCRRARTGRARAARPRGTAAPRRRRRGRAATSTEAVVVGDAERLDERPDVGFVRRAIVQVAFSIGRSRVRTASDGRTRGKSAWHRAYNSAPVLRTPSPLARSRRDRVRSRARGRADAR